MSTAYRLRFRQQALDDLDQIVAEIARDSPQNAENFRDRALESFDRVRVFPQACRVLFPDDPQAAHIRRGFIRKQPNHVFFFRIDGQDLIIIRVIHAGRDNLQKLMSGTD